MSKGKKKTDKKSEETVVEDVVNNNTETTEATMEVEKEEEKQEEVVLSPEEKLEAEVKEAKDKYLRLYSEFENFRRRTAKEKLELIGSANESLIQSLLTFKLLGFHLNEIESFRSLSRSQSFFLLLTLYEYDGGQRLYNTHLLQKD